MQRKSLDIWVGLFVVLGVAALLFLALKAGNADSLSFAQTYQITARFDNIGSLRTRRR
jgi:phospholipid/cholesterol/gamma-HCH transport system substrate-binding protein